MPTTRTILPDDLYRIQCLAEPQISPDGRWAAVLVIVADKETDGYAYRIRLCDLETDNVVIVAGDRKKIRSLRFSTDGSILAWIESAPMEKERICVLRVDEALQIHSGAEPISSKSKYEGVVEPAIVHEVFTSERLGKTFEWYPGKQVLYIPVLHVTHSDIKVYQRPHYKSDGVGLVELVTSEIWEVQLIDDPSRSTTTCLYEHPDAIASLTVDATGKLLVFTSDSKDKEFFAQEIYALDLKSRTGTLVLEAQGPISALAFAPDGRQIAWIGHRGPRWNDITQALWLTDVHTRDTRCTTQAFDRPVAPYGLGDVRPLQAPSQLSFGGGNALLFLASDHGVSSLYRLAEAGGEPQRILSDEHPAVSYFSVSASGDVLFTGGTPTRPDALYHWREGKEKLLFDPNSTLFDEIQVREPHKFTFDARDHLPIEAWLMLPVGNRAHQEASYPLVLVIHGGPHNAYGYGFQMEFQTLCAAGFAVLYVNPRGSQTYGQSFASAVIGDWGGEDAQDLLQALDMVSANDFVDADRIGVTGYSYGGFMTNWLIGHSNRFRAAAAGGCVANLVSFHGTSDIGPVFGYDEHGTHVWDDPARLWQRSPIAFAKNVDTPLLLYHAETDDRCPIGQSEEFYTALATLNKNVTFVRYSQGSHLFLTQGRPSFRVDRMNRLIGWFSKTLNECSFGGA
ncbi:alpha/beta hydrolase family protein [Alicyclobacillus dauci]|uniref:Acyl-peptide hydrolase n=1 Tax=Alicyclobacillus dauci TaxID=1475485 RepID=A0ABY6Z553_9BACL|nr:S9 family peptidase [Alicyclobacillus dauci]WAH37999.1 S9 family peptidase [Alicyclobacillus dauci]